MNDETMETTVCVCEHMTGISVHSYKVCVCVTKACKVQVGSSVISRDKLRSEESSPALTGGTIVFK